MRLLMEGPWEHRRSPRDREDHGDPTTDLQKTLEVVSRNMEAGVSA
jgi:hypothetical protein